ncbi:hypothetical protein GCM10027567_12290 [Spongiibacter taiwanensis]
MEAPELKMKDQVEKPVASPCVSVCALDDEDVCTGCFRDLDEIARWSTLDNPARREVLLRCQQRRKARFGDFGLG